MVTTRKRREELFRGGEAETMKKKPTVIAVVVRIEKTYVAVE